MLLITLRIMDEENRCCKDYDAKRIISDKTNRSKLTADE